MTRSTPPSEMAGSVAHVSCRDVERSEQMRAGGLCGLRGLCGGLAELAGLSCPQNMSDKPGHVLRCPCCPHMSADRTTSRRQQERKAGIAQRPRMRKRLPGRAWLTAWGGTDITKGQSSRLALCY